MSRLILALILTVLLTGPAAAQTPPLQPVPMQTDIIHFATEYTQSVIIGVLVGGVLMNIVVGGGGATLAGALAGSTLASLLFINSEAGHYIIQHTGPTKH